MDLMRLRTSSESRSSINNQSESVQHMSYYCEECGREVEAYGHWYDDWSDAEAVADLEPLLKDIDVLGNPGFYWYIVGAASLLSLFAVTAVWRLANRVRSL